MKILKMLVSVTVLASMLFIAGCDQFDDFSVNVPLALTFIDSTSTDTITKVGIYDLDENSVYQEYRERIEDFEFVEAKYIVTDIDPEDLTGHIELTVRQDDENGNILIRTERIFEPETDLNTSYSFEMTPEEITFFNNYLIAAGSKVFWGQAHITNIEGSSEKKEVTVKVHILLKAKGAL